VTRPVGRVLAAALTALLVTATMSPAAAAKKKPAKITSVTAASRLVNQGAPFHFTVSAKNSSTKRSVPVGLMFVLSESSDYDDGVALGAGTIPALARKARVALPFSVTIPSTQPDDDYRLLICVPRAGKSPACSKNVSVDVEEVTTQPSGSPSGGSTSPGSGSVLPSSIVNLANWKLTLPVDSRGLTSGTAAEKRQPELNAYQHPTWFHANATNNGVVFQAQADGATTSGETQYARSELREMTGSGQTDAGWSPNSGTHVMTLSQAITKLPGTSKPEVVAGQIHDGSDDVLQIRLEGRRLFLSLDNGKNEVELTASYTLGTRFTVTISAIAGGISVTYDGASKLTNFKPSKPGSSWYFKAGCYTQSNESGSFSEVVVYDLRVVHS
jgi:hypothetical protein